MRASRDTTANMTSERWSEVRTECCDEATTETVRSNHAQELFIILRPLHRPRDVPQVKLAFSLSGGNCSTVQLRLDRQLRLVAPLDQRRLQVARRRLEIGPRGGLGTQVRGGVVWVKGAVYSG